RLSTAFVEKPAAGGADLALVHPETVRDRKIILVLDVATMSEDVVSTGPLLLLGAPLARCESLLGGHAGRQDDQRQQQSRQISNHCDPPFSCGCCLANLVPALRPRKAVARDYRPSAAFPISRGGPMRAGWNSTAAAMVHTSARAINLPMLDVPGWLDIHRLPNAVAVVMALYITARVRADCNSAVCPARHAMM